MAYQVLARKWRPRNFNQVVGQQHVLTALVNALDMGRLHHAYLFSGTRGVGKTTIARILAKCLNCERGISSQPCGECSSCREIDQGNFVDLLEIDAASRTKVEDTRELLDNVQYRPARGRFKVYLIDEVHMLSRHSFNALLKTLEEPPPYVKFLLATTDPQKLPITILSRCLQFHLKALDRELIVGQLAQVLEAEQQPFEPEALPLLAKAADGSMRDALSLTDQALAHGNGSVRRDLVLAMLGSLDQRHLHQLLRQLAALDGAGLLAKVAELSQQGPDFEQVHAELASLLHRIALAQLLAGSLDPQATDAAEVEQLARSFSAEEIQLYYQIALTGRKELPFAPDGRAGLEMTLLRMLAFAPRRESMAPPSLTFARSLMEPLAAASVPPVRGEAKALAPAVPAPSRQRLLDEQAALLAQAEQLRAAPAGDAGIPGTPIPDQMSNPPPPPAAPRAAEVARPEFLPAPQEPKPQPEPQPEQSLQRMLQVRNQLRSKRDQAAPGDMTATPARQPAVPPSPAAPSRAARPERPPAVVVPVAKLGADETDLPPWELPPLESYQGDDLGRSDDEGEVGDAASPGKPVNRPTAAARPSAPPSPVAVSPAARPTSPSPAASPAVDSSEASEQWQSNDLLRGCGDAWAELIADADLRGLLRQLALHCSLTREGDSWQLILSPERRHLMNDKTVADLGQRLASHLGRPIRLGIELGEPLMVTPFQLERQRYQQLLTEAQQALGRDPHVQFFIERFGATLDADSIQPLKP